MNDANLGADSDADADKRRSIGRSPLASGRDGGVDAPAAGGGSQSLSNGPREGGVSGTATAGGEDDDESEAGPSAAATVGYDAKVLDQFPHSDEFCGSGLLFLHTFNPRPHPSTATSGVAGGDYGAAGSVQGGLGVGDGSSPLSSASNSPHVGGPAAPPPAVVIGDDDDANDTPNPTNGDNRSTTTSAAASDTAGSASQPGAAGVDSANGSECGTNAVVVLVPEDGGCVVAWTLSRSPGRVRVSEPSVIDCTETTGSLLCTAAALDFGDAVLPQALPNYDFATGTLDGRIKLWSVHTAAPNGQSDRDGGPRRRWWW